MSIAQEWCNPCAAVAADTVQSVDLLAADAYPLYSQRISTLR